MVIFFVPPYRMPTPILGIGVIEGTTYKGYALLYLSASAGKSENNGNNQTCCKDRYAQP